MKYLLLFALVNMASAQIYVAYYVGWATYGRNYQVSNIPFDKLSHINYAFANIDSSGKIAIGDSYADIDKPFPGDSWDSTKQAYRGNFWQLLKVAKPKYPNLKIMISVGGWTWSKEFSNVAASAASRKVFVDSVVAFLTQYDFDGVDIDWEYPVGGGLPTNVYSPNDGQNYNLLLAALRAGLDTMPGPRKLLTIAAPAGLQIAKHLIINEMAKYVDFINVMTYDYRGGWSKYTGHQTLLYATPSNLLPADDPDKSLGDTASAIDYYLTQGMPSNKLVVGFAMYGRGWTGVSSTNNGLYQTFSTVPKGTWDDGTSGNTGVYDYKDVKSKIATGVLNRYWDDVVKAPWAFKDGLMISFDDPQSVKEKIKYVQAKKLGGLMTWELSGDSQNELSGVVYDNLFGSGGIPPPSSDTGSPSSPGGSNNTFNNHSSKNPKQTTTTNSSSSNESQSSIFNRSFIVGLVLGAAAMLLLFIIAFLGFWLATRKRRGEKGGKYFEDAESPVGSKDSLKGSNKTKQMPKRKG